MNKHTHQESLGSGRLRWTDIKSDAYWLKAFFNQPSSTCFFNSAVMFVGSTTGRPISPGASGELSAGGISTLLSKTRNKSEIVNYYWREVIELRHSNENTARFICKLKFEKKKLSNNSYAETQASKRTKPLIMWDYHFEFISLSFIAVLMFVAWLFSNRMLYCVIQNKCSAH